MTADDNSITKRAPEPAADVQSGREYLIVHGWEGSGPDHWQTWLANKLTAAGETVRYPRLPDPDHPVLERWLEALDDEVMAMGEPRIVICHSLGSALWLHYAQQRAFEPVSRLLLVAPPGPKTLEAVTEVSGFSPIPLAADTVHQSAEDIRLVCSSGDEYCQEGGAEYYGENLSLTTDVLPPEAGHINTDSAYGAWPEVFEWCFDHDVRFSG